MVVILTGLTVSSWFPLRGDGGVCVCVWGEGLVALDREHFVMTDGGGDVFRRSSVFSSARSALTVRPNTQIRHR